MLCRIIIDHLPARRLYHNTSLDVCLHAACSHNRQRFGGFVISPCGVLTAAAGKHRLIRCAVRLRDHSTGLFSCRRDRRACPQHCKRRKCRNNSHPFFSSHKKFLLLHKISQIYVCVIAEKYFSIFSILQTFHKVNCFLQNFGLFVSRDRCPHRPTALQYKLDHPTNFCRSNARSNPLTTPSALQSAICHCPCVSVSAPRRYRWRRTASVTVRTPSPSRSPGSAAAT